MILYLSQSTLPAFNLAVEDYFFCSVQEEILFLYVNEPCVVIGCNQVLEAEVDAEFCKHNNIPVFRRKSGGGAVYHDTGNLNYCLISNRITGKSVLGNDFLQPIVSVLAELNIDVLIGKRKDLWLPDEFKISGTASHITKNRELHHGTLLYDSDLEILTKSLSAKQLEIKLKGIASVPSPVKNIRAYLSDQNKPTPTFTVFFEMMTQKLLKYYELESVSIFNNDDITEIQPLKLPI